MIFGCVLILILLLLLLTAVIWLPLVILTSPIWLSTVLVLVAVFSYFKYWGTIGNKVSQFYSWLFFSSNKPRKWVWQQFYSFLAWCFPQQEWKCMNYGYAVSSESGHTIRLDSEDESERFPYQLYHYMSTGLDKFSNLSGFDVLEVGSGRGGGLHFITRTLNPNQALGIDYSNRQVEFCKGAYKLPNLKFEWGDAENLPVRSESVDMVLNVESAHTYGNLGSFISEATRVLKPGGHLLITDFISASALTSFETALNRDDLQLLSKVDVTSNVLAALSLDSDRRVSLIKSKTPRVLHKLLIHFSGASGSSIYSGMTSGETVYMAYHLVKPK